MHFNKFVVTTSALVLASGFAFADPANPSVNGTSSDSSMPAAVTMDAPTNPSAPAMPVLNAPAAPAAGGVNAPVAVNVPSVDSSSAMPSAVGNPSAATSAMPAPTANEPKAPSIASNAMIAPTMVIPSSGAGLDKVDSKAPSPTKADVESILSEVNGHDPIKVADQFAKEGFSYMTDSGDVLKSMSDIGGFISKAGEANASDINFKVSSLQELANGAALAVGGFTSGDQNSPAGQKTGNFSAVLSYNGSDWKIVNLQLTPVLAADDHDHDHSGGMMGMLLSAVIGAVVGFLGSRFMANRH